jgi:hypothetical protein
LGEELQTLKEEYVADVNYARASEDTCERLEVLEADLGKSRDALKSVTSSVDRLINVQKLLLSCSTASSAEVKRSIVTSAVEKLGLSYEVESVDATEALLYFVKLNDQVVELAKEISSVNAQRQRFDEHDEVGSFYQLARAIEVRQEHCAALSREIEDSEERLATSRVAVQEREQQRRAFLLQQAAAEQQIREYREAADEEQSRVEAIAELSRRIVEEEQEFEEEKRRRYKTLQDRYLLKMGGTELAFGTVQKRIRRESADAEHSGLESTLPKASLLSALEVESGGSALVYQLQSRRRSGRRQRTTFTVSVAEPSSAPTRTMGNEVI